MAEPAAKLVLMMDNPVEDLGEDCLRLTGFADTVAGTALGNRGPFTIGIFGEWGSGKTSMLRLAERMVHAEGSAVTVWFNAWQHEKVDEPLFPLIASILAAMEKRNRDDEVRDPARGKERSARERRGRIYTALRALVRGMKFKAEVAMPLIAKAGVELDAAKVMEAEEILGAQVNPLQGELLYTKAFDLLSDQAKESGAKVVVFVDDLDRCDPESAVRLLESIKLILWQPGFIFVLALDEKVISSYLKRQYVEKHGLDKEREWGDFYLEKIINLPLRVPRHDRSFVDYCIKRVEALVESCRPPATAAENWQPPVELTALGRTAGALAAGCGRNPRAFVRQVNRFLVSCRLWTAWRQQSQELPQEGIFAIAVDVTLSKMLGDQDTYDLAHDQRLCEEVFQELTRASSEAPDSASRGADSGRPQTDRERLRSRVMAILGNPVNQSLRDLVCGEEGKVWLTSQDVRSEVREFFAATASKPKVSLDGVVADAVRRALGLGADEDLTMDRLAQVKALDLSGAQVTDEDLASLEMLTSLTSLDLSDTRVTDEGLASLKKLSSLERLYLSSTQVTDKGLASLEKLASLTGLNLSSTQVTDEGLASLEKLTSLTGLVLSSTRVTDEGLVSLGKLTRLTALDLSVTWVTDEGLASLEKLASLTRLNLRNTRVTDKGLASLEKLTSLTELDLTSTKVTDKGLASLEKLASLTRLDLSFTQVTGKGLASLEKLTSLTGLNLSSTQVTDEGLASLGKLTSLTSLALSVTRVTDEGLASLEKLTSLERLDLTFTQVTERARAALHKKLRRCGIVWAGLLA